MAPLGLNSKRIIICQPSIRLGICFQPIRTCNWVIPFGIQLPISALFGHVFGLFPGWEFSCLDSPFGHTFNISHPVGYLYLSSFPQLGTSTVIIPSWAFFVLGTQLGTLFLYFPVGNRLSLKLLKLFISCRDFSFSFSFLYFIPGTMEVGYRSYTFS